MRILFLADVVGRPGRHALATILPQLISEYEAEFVIVNCENAAAGYGITASTAQELFDAGAHCLTSGNHVWAQKEAIELLEAEPRLLRPANYPPGAPGAGARVFHNGNHTPIAVINLLGRVFMEAVDCPFRVGQQLVEELSELAKVIIVDFHAEATSEKQAMGWFLDGKVSAVVGTHTHVQTADERILPAGTAYITDAGMCGALDSVIGVDKDIAVRRFLSGLPARFQVPKRGPATVQGVIIDVDEQSGRARKIERVNVTCQPRR